MELHISVARASGMLLELRKEILQISRHSVSATMMVATRSSAETQLRSGTSSLDATTRQLIDVAANPPKGDHLQLGLETLTATTSERLAHAIGRYIVADRARLVIQGEVRLHWLPRDAGIAVRALAGSQSPR